MTGAVVSRAFFGSAPFFTAIPHGLTVGGDYTYLLIVVLGIAAGLIGVAFKTFLYRLEDVADELWKGRPEWARPAVGGLLLGALLLVLPQMYGVGYPVMDRAVAGHYLRVVHRRADGREDPRHQPHALDRRLRRRVRAVAVHRRDGGNGVRDRRPTTCSGAAIGPPAMYAVVAMGGVFGAAAQAPLTAIASVVEMTGNFTLTVPVMLAVGIASALSKQLSYGSIYTTKLLRRGIDIERPKTSGVLQQLTVAEVMQRFSPVSEQGAQLHTGESGPADSPGAAERPWADLIGAVADIRRPQALFADETLEQALRQLVLYGPAGLPVLSHDGERLLGWITRQNVLGAIAQRVGASAREIEQGALAGEYARPDAEARVHTPSTPLDGYELVEIVIGPHSPALGQRLDEVAWPPRTIAAAVTEGREIVAPRPDLELRVGERVVLLAPAARRAHDTEALTPT